MPYIPPTGASTIRKEEVPGRRDGEHENKGRVIEESTQTIQTDEPKSSPTSELTHQLSNTTLSPDPSPSLDTSRRESAISNPESTPSLTADSIASASSSSVASLATNTEVADGEGGGDGVDSPITSFGEVEEGRDDAVLRYKVGMVAYTVSSVQGGVWMRLIECTCLLYIQISIYLIGLTSTYDLIISMCPLILPTSTLQRDLYLQAKQSESRKAKTAAAYGGQFGTKQSGSELCSFSFRSRRDLCASIARRYKPSQPIVAQSTFPP
jgi:hypothetical protein